MNFGSILEEWERQAKSPGIKYSRNPFTDDTSEKDKASGSSVFQDGEEGPGRRRYRLLRKKPDAAIDLHGLSRDEAWPALENFFLESSKNGSEKVLIIHGKGNHGNESILKDMVRHFIECNALAGESGYNSARDGGTGATWVILKRRD